MITKYGQGLYEEQDVRCSTCIRSNKSLNDSSLSRCNSVSSAQTSSRTLRAIYRSNTRVSRLPEHRTGDESGDAGKGGNGFVVYGGLTCSEYEFR